MNYNTDIITSSIKDLELATSELFNSLSGEWDDEVKESYFRYISQCNEYINTIQNAYSKIRQSCEKMCNVNVDELIDSAESICLKIDEVTNHG